MTTDTQTVSGDGAAEDKPDPAIMADDGQRSAVADLLRVAEPADRLLRAGVAVEGAQAVLERILSHSSDDAEAALHWAQCHGLELTGPGAVLAFERWRTRSGELDAARDLRVMGRLDARLVTYGDREWPAGLVELGLDEPLGLWVRGPGSLAELVCGSVAMVGARAADSYGQHLARSCAYDCVASGRSVVSGGAFGIDAAAHEGAITAAEGSVVGTVAFMAGGVDRFYPRGNDSLLSHIARNWLVVSEAPPGASAMRHRFLLRNRLIAACAAATVVVQAGWRSGAINTANRAAELMRPVAAFPGAVTSAESAGCHRLIREGAAVLVTDFAEVAELLEPLDPAAGLARDGQQATVRPTDDLSDAELQVYSALPTRRGAEVTAIAVRAGLDPRSAMAALAGLELAGLARRAQAGWTKARPVG